MRDPKNQAGKFFGRRDRTPDVRCPQFKIMSSAWQVHGRRDSTPAVRCHISWPALMELCRQLKTRRARATDVGTVHPPSDARRSRARAERERTPFQHASSKPGGQDLRTSGKNARRPMPAIQSTWQGHSAEIPMVIRTHGKYSRRRKSHLTPLAYCRTRHRQNANPGRSASAWGKFPALKDRQRFLCPTPQFKTRRASDVGTVHPPSAARSSRSGRFTDVGTVHPPSVTQSSRTWQVHGKFMDGGTVHPPSIATFLGRHSWNCAGSSRTFAVHQADLIAS